MWWVDIAYLFVTQYLLILIKYWENIKIFLNYFHNCSDHIIILILYESYIKIFGVWSLRNLKFLNLSFLLIVYCYISKIVTIQVLRVLRCSSIQPKSTPMLPSKPPDVLFEVPNQSVNMDSRDWSACSVMLSYSSLSILQVVTYLLRLCHQLNY